MRKYGRGLKCFSPEVMLATFLIEIILAVYTFVRYRLNIVGRLSVAMLVLLAVFQAAEYNVCGGQFIEPMWAARIGFVAITLLPPLGVHLAYAIVGSKKRPWLRPAYGAAAGFVLLFLFAGQSLAEHVCQGNYVIFSLVPGSEWLYTIYYYGLLAVTIWVCAKFIEVSKQQNIRRALGGLIIGYLAFIVPTTAANVIDAMTIEGIPSIMCGFAVLLALMLTCWILPYAGTKRRQKIDL